MKLRRFKVDSLDASRVTVSGREARHGLRVLRLDVGSQVVLFDGGGGEAHGTICERSRDTFTVQIHILAALAKPAGPGLTLAVAAPKGERADWMVEKCAELGARLLIPLKCERSQVMPGEGKLDRWRRKAKEAAKQSGGSTILEIAAPKSIADVCSEAAGHRMFWADPDPGLTAFSAALGDPSAASSSKRAPPNPTPACQAAPITLDAIVFIGPEGGFTAAERDHLDSHGARPVRLAVPILRIETAAVAAASVWAEWRCRG